MKKKNLKIVMLVVWAIVLLVVLFFVVKLNYFNNAKQIDAADKIKNEIPLEETYPENTASDIITSASSTFVKYAFPQLSIGIPKDTNYVPIIMYHQIRVYPEPGKKFNKIAAALSVSPESFKEQMQWLVSNNYETINFTQLVKYLNKEITFEGKKPIILTFDDGYKNAYQEALPIMEKFKQKGIFYIVSTYHGRNGFVSDEEIKDLEKRGMIVGSHTRRHSNLKNLSISAAMEEIVGSKDDLEILLGHKVEDFAYPYSERNASTIDLLKKAGYQSAVLINPIVATEKNDLFKLPRIWVYDNADFSKMFP